MLYKGPSPQNPYVPKVTEDVAPVATIRDPEARRIYEWRIEMFRALGYNELQAERLADGTADWHYVKEHLLDRGCSLEEALDLST